ncbi:MAG TPA: hypothetical protein VM100_03000 [Longimicrobiales bacterium]|nr:hypothetical protein [Longimicrobiales bacterium]
MSVFSGFDIEGVSYALIGAIILTACDSSTTANIDPNDAFPSGVGQLSFAPVDSIGEIVPLGHIAPFSHTLPTDHIYFYYRKTRGVRCPCSAAPAQQVRAPGPGTVIHILHPSGNDDKVTVQMTKTTYYYLDHVLLLPNVVVGTKITAGQIIANTPPNALSLDLGYINYDFSQQFVAPVRYGPFTVHADAPLKYYAEPVRSKLYSLVLRPAGETELDGRINFDVAGRLAGNWFHETLANTEGSAGTQDGWIKSLTFAYDEYDPKLPRVAWGGVIGPANQYAFELTDPRPADVTPASGVVHYHLYTLDSITGFKSPAGELVVQMISADQIKVELGSQFTTNAQIYKR